MSFKPAEKEILDIAYQTFIIKEFALKLFAEKHSSAGFEAWIVGELIIQFEIRDMNPEKKQDPDMIVNGIKIEIKGCAHFERARSAGWLIADYIRHPRCDVLHLFVFSYNNNIMNHLLDFFNVNNIIHEERKLGESGWMVMISKKTMNTPTPIHSLPYRSWARTRS